MENDGGRNIEGHSGVSVEMKGMIVLTRGTTVENTVVLVWIYAKFYANASQLSGIKRLPQEWGSGGRRFKSSRSDQ